MTVYEGCGLIFIIVQGTLAVFSGFMERDWIVHLNLTLTNHSLSNAVYLLLL